MPLRHEVERHLVEEALHAQKGCEMRLVEDAAGDIEKIEQSLADDVAAWRIRATS